MLLPKCQRHVRSKEMTSWWCHFKHVPSLKLTAFSHLKIGCLEDDPASGFGFRPIFRGKLALSLREWSWPNWSNFQFMKIKKSGIPFGKLTWQWKMNLLKMYSLLKMVIFHCYVWLPECILAMRLNYRFELCYNNEVFSPIFIGNMYWWTAFWQYVPNINQYYAVFHLSSQNIQKKVCKCIQDDKNNYIFRPQNPNY